MALQNFTWNNGTQDSPIVLSSEQIKALSDAGKNSDINTNIGGYITTTTRKIQKFLKLSLEKQFPNLHVVVDEELADTFGIQLSGVNLTEGSSAIVTITGDSGITNDYISYNWNYKNITISGDISEEIIKSRIHVNNGELLIDDPEENANWSAIVELTAYPSYYEGTSLSDIPSNSKPSVTFTVTAKAITGIKTSVEKEYPINTDVVLNITPVPSDSTKLKGAVYTYTTTTPDIVFCSADYIRTQNVVGDANITINLTTCGGKVKLNSTVNFSVYNLQPTSFIIDQRGNITDPSGMISDNCVLENGVLRKIDGGTKGDSRENTINWLREHTHAYLGKYDGFSTIKLKQLDDTDRTKFADGTSSVDYISNDNGEYDVWLKFDSDIYYKSESWYADDSLTKDDDYVLVTIAKQLPSGENEDDWQKFSQYNLIGVYQGFVKDNKLFSLSNKKQNLINKNATNYKEYANSRGSYNFTTCTYQVYNLIALLCFGWYKTINISSICGNGTKNYTNIYNPKLTGLTDSLAMTDTTTATGTGATTPDTAQITQGYGDDIKSVNFWGLENIYGDFQEGMSDTYIMTNGYLNNRENPTQYLPDYIDAYGAVLITDKTGITATYSTRDEFITKFSSDNDLRFFVIKDDSGKIIRAIETSHIGTSTNYIPKKLIFGKYVDFVYKAYSTTSADISKYYCTYQSFASNNNIYRSGYSNSVEKGLCGMIATASTSNTLARLMFKGTANTVHMIDDATETL